MALPSPGPLGLDDFHFTSMDFTEDMTRYTPGGYHPVIVGDILGPSSESSDSESRRYRIMHKLGYGTYATVWLAEKTDSMGAFVAVKITTADGSPTTEAAMLEAACQNSGHPSHIVTLLDHFTLHGPNGTHSVLVMDVVAPMVSLMKYGHSPLWRKISAYGLVQAVVQIHGAGVVHGDLHLGNVGVEMGPQLANQDPYEVMQEVGDYDFTVVLTGLAAQQTPSLPAYVVVPCPLAKYYHKIAPNDLPQTKLFDFGTAHKAGKLPHAFGCANEACAPEMGFARAVERIDNPFVEPSADIWALGTAIYEIVAGRPPFYHGLPSLLNDMAVMAGSLAAGWQAWYASKNNPPEVSPAGADAWWASHRSRLRSRCKDEADVENLIRLLRKVLVMDPAARPTAAEILQDPWFIDAVTALKPESLVQPNDAVPA